MCMIACFLNEKKIIRIISYKIFSFFQPLDQLQLSLQKRKKRSLSAMSSRWRKCSLVFLHTNFVNLPMSLQKETERPTSSMMKKESLATTGTGGLWPGIQTSCHFENLKQLQQLEPWASIELQSHLSLTYLRMWWINTS